MLNSTGLANPISLLAYTQVWKRVRAEEKLSVAPETQTGGPFWSFSQLVPGGCYYYPPFQ